MSIRGFTTTILVAAALLLMACSGGEADYSLDAVEGSQLSFVSSSNVTVEDNATEIIQLEVISQSSVVFAIVGGADSALFDVNATTGLVTFARDINGTTLYWANPDKFYDLVVQATDTALETVNMVITIQIFKDLTVIPPVIDPGANTTPSVIPVSGEVITVITAVSVSGTPITYSLSGPDGHLFAIDENGSLSFITAPDFLFPIDADGNNIYEVTITVTDDYQTSTIDLHITVLSNPNIVPPTIASSTFTYVENDTNTLQIVAASGTVSPLTYTLNPGLDASEFDINATTGVLSFKTAPDYEAPSDADQNSIYVIDLNVTDEYSNTLSKIITIAVSGINEGVAGFTSYLSLKNDGGTDVAVDALREQTHYTMIFAPTPIVQTDTITYTLSAYDPNIFSIVNGELSIQVPSISSFLFTVYEYYDVTVTATDEHGNSSVLTLSFRARST